MSQAPATRPANPVNTLRALIESDSTKKELARALPKVLPADRFVRTLITTLNRMPELAECDQKSVMAGIVTAAQLGLEIDPTLGRAYLIPYNDRSKGKIAQLIIGYRGFVELAYRSGMLASLQAEVVYEGDEFDFELGLEPKLRHVPQIGEQRGALRFAYAVAKLANGGVVFRVLGPADIKKAKASSRAASSSYSPWTTHPDEMWRKTAIRALAKMLPLSPELRDAVAADDDDDLSQPLRTVAPADVAIRTDEPAPAGEPQQGAKDAVPADPPKDIDASSPKIVYQTIWARLHSQDERAALALRQPPTATVDEYRRAANACADLLGEPRPYA